MRAINAYVRLSLPKGMSMSSNLMGPMCGLTLYHYPGQHCKKMFMDCFPVLHSRLLRVCEIQPVIDANKIPVMCLVVFDLVWDASWGQSKQTILVHQRHSVTHVCQRCTHFQDIGSVAK